MSLTTNWHFQFHISQLEIKWNFRFAFSLYCSITNCSQSTMVDSQTYSYYIVLRIQYQQYERSFSNNKNKIAEFYMLIFVCLFISNNLEIFLAFPPAISSIKRYRNILAKFHSEIWKKKHQQHAPFSWHYAIDPATNVSTWTWPITEMVDWIE